MKSMTVSAKPETVKRDWYVVDASGKTLGRLCSELARRLRGKHKPVFTPHVDTGDYLVVINAEKIAVTGNKLQDKKYHRFTGYVGNLKTETLAQALERHPERVIEIAVKGMLPKGPLGRAMYRKLKVYAGAEHPHLGIHVVGGPKDDDRRVETRRLGLTQPGHELEAAHIGQNLGRSR